MELFYYTIGQFIKIPDVHLAYTYLNFNDCNGIILDNHSLKNSHSLRHFCYNLNNYFRTIDQSYPNPFVIISDKATNEIKQHFNSIIFNSSIWIWYLDLSLEKKEFTKQCNFIKEGMQLSKRNYQINNSKEFIDFNLRLQSQNYLFNLEKGHGRNITPQIYSDEFQKRQEIKISDDLKSFFNRNESGKKDIQRVKLRILLIDDKIGEEHCKTDLIKNLLELKFDIEKQHDVYWFTTDNSETTVDKNIFFSSENIQAIKDQTAISIDLEIENPLLKGVIKNILQEFDNLKFISVKNKDLTDLCLSIFNKSTGITLKEIIEQINRELKSIESVYTNKFELKIGKNGLLTQEMEKEIKKDTEKIQIIAIKSIDLATKLLSNGNLRFDLIMMDYLLDKKHDKTGNESIEREYATEFWGDGTEKFFELSPEAKLNDEYKRIKELYDNIKFNRGPMHKLWVFPITAFNQTFIDDLRNKGIRLIDYYWYLSRGADPINTPYLFINALNKFIQLQVENAIFSEEEIFGFLSKSLDRIKERNTFEDFTSFMGAEYTVFVEKYMMRPVIYKDKQAGSLFAKYIWDNFYSNPNYLKLFKLVQHVHKFYHCCAFGSIADHDNMILFWRELKIFLNEDYTFELQNLRLDKFHEKLIEIIHKR